MEDWEPGDKAVCINDEPCNCGCKPRRKISGLIADKFYEVRAVSVETNLKGEEYVFLEVGLPPQNDKFHSSDSGGCGSYRFRKLRHDPREGHGEDFVRLLNAHRSKQPTAAPKVPAGNPLLPHYLPPKKGETL